MMHDRFKFMFIVACLWCAFAFQLTLAASQSPEPDLLTYGTPTRDFTIRGDYALSFNGMSRTPRWTLEHHNANSIQKNVERNFSFHVDPEIPNEFAPSPKDYAGSGFDLGHSASFRSHSRSRDLAIHTFTVANAMPQPHALNGGAWRNLEATVRATAEKPGVEVWEVTAPIWVAEKKIEAIGESKIWVPHFCGKAILIGDNGSVRCMAWIMPNERCDKPLDMYAVTVDQFEKWTGLDVFSGLEDRIEKALEKALEAGKLPPEKD